MTKKTSPKARTSRRRDGITVRTIGRKTYEVDYSVEIAGKPHRVRRKSPFQTIERSLEWAKQDRAARLSAGGRPTKKSSPRVDPEAPRTFGYWATRYLEDSTSNPARSRGTNRPGTLVSKEKLLRLHLLPYFRTMVITQLDDLELERFALQQSKVCATVYINQQLGLLKAVMRFGQRRGCASERALQMPELSLTPAPSEVDGAIPATLCEEDTEALLSRISGDDLFFALLTFRQGMRPGEALAFRSSDLDLAHNQLTIARTWSRATGYGPTKGGRPRTIPIHREVRLELKQRESRPPGLLIQSPRGPDQPPAPRTVAVHLQTHVDDLGLVDRKGEPLRYFPKMGRHSFGRHWAERGFPLVGLQRILGHADLKTTQIYAHWTRAASADLLDMIGSPQPTLLDQFKSASAEERASLAAHLRAARA